MPVHNFSGIVSLSGFLSARRATLLAAALAFAVADVRAGFTYPGCAPVTDADFRIVRVVGRANDPALVEPLKMAFNADAQGRTEIYFIERAGNLKFYDPATGKVSLLGKIPTETGNEDGLTGIALDPGFRANHRIFFYYAHATGFRVSRFALDAATRALDLASEKVVLTIPSKRSQIHTAGALQFDAYGDLWINVGDNRSLRTGPANTHDLRGGILRIHPNPDGTYSIPKGNLWEVAAARFDAKGMPEVAAQYRDTAKARRERYVMGARNPYTLTVDPVRRWAIYGDCGPDEMPHIFAKPPPEKWTEEQDVVTAPGFRGWPYWTGYRHVQDSLPRGYISTSDGPGSWGDWSGMDTAAPVNDHPEAAIRFLPPAEPGTYVYPHECAMTGPIFRYDGSLASPYQLPPHFNRLWFVTDFDRGFVKAIRLTREGRMADTAVDVFGKTPVSAPLDFQQGPDGALYILNYSCGPWRLTEPDSCTGILRIQYAGTCKDPALLPEKPEAIGTNQGSRPGAEYAGEALRVSTAGPHEIEILDVGGRVLRRLPGDAPRSYNVRDMARGLGAGCFFVRVRSAAGSWMFRLREIDPLAGPRGED